MKELLEYIVKAIVVEPEQVSITEETSDEGLLIKLEVAEEDTRVRLEIV